MPEVIDPTWKRANTDWFSKARWGVMTHYLGSPEETADAWNKRVDSIDVQALADQVVLAAQQADTAAEAIAALAGLPVEPTPLHPVIHGILLTGGAPRYLGARITGGHGFSSEITDEPTWSPPAKIAAKYLAPYLDERARAR